MAQFLFVFWMILNVILFVYAVFESILLVIAIFAGKENQELELVEFPYVTVQLPLYNEKYVIERLLTSMTELDYPKDKLEIQILDDSTDETSEIITQFLDGLEDNQLFKHIQRKDRNGIKAGALEEVMKFCKGEFIAIFDADFVPNSSFLIKTLPYFKDVKIAAVQTRWTHLNESLSLSLIHISEPTRPY